MTSRNRRTFLKELGLTVGAVTFGTSTASALLFYQKKSIRRTPAVAAPAPVDFRYAPASWHSPVCPPRDPFKSAVTGSGEYLFPGAPELATAGDETVAFRIGGGGEYIAQECKEPQIPVVRTSLSFSGTTVEVTAFSTGNGDGRRMDHMEISLVAPEGGFSPEIIIKSPRELEIKNEEDGDFDLGGVCFVRMPGESDRVFLAVDALCTGERQGDHVILRPSTGTGGPGARVQYLVTIPLGNQDDGEIQDAFKEWTRLRASSETMWRTSPLVLSPVSWGLWGAYEDFKTTSIRVIEQMNRPRRAEGTTVDEPVLRRVTNVADEHFIAEAERYSGRDTDAQARLVNIWNLQNDEGMIVGEGGESDWKQTSVAVYALCRHAELSGDWSYFDELYPDSYNAMMEFRNMRDRAQAGNTANGRYGILPEGSPGPGWDGNYEEFTNTVWALAALRILLEVSDRFFLPQKGEIRDFYGQLRASFIRAAREGVKTHDKGYSYLPMIYGGRVAGTGADPVRPQSAQDVLAQGLYPGLLFPREDQIVRSYLSVMEGVSEEDIPVETGPGPDGSYLPEAGAILAQVHLWAGNSDKARKAFVGFLNHASPVRTWEDVQYLGVPGTGASRSVTRGGINVRASAECLRYLRHMMVLEDDKVLRLFDGITPAELADGKPLRVLSTPTRWGRVTLVHEPLDARAWKTRFTREPVNPVKAPALKSIEMPRKLLPNFHFDTITGTTAIKNGPRIYIDGSATEWECTWRDFRRY